MSSSNPGNNIVVVGAGAAGYFAAIHAKQKCPDKVVFLLEGTRKALSKLLISGGGRCNVTNHTFEVESLLEGYPRGARELRGPFSRFQPEDTMKWFEAQGVTLKVEADKRVFPTTDDSSTVADCLQQRARKLGVQTLFEHRVTKISHNAKSFQVSIAGKASLHAAIVILTTGGSKASFKLAEELGHTIIDPVPSLFTFVVKNKRLRELAGVSVSNVALSLDIVGSRKTFSAEGPLLVTHWGVSGPGVIKLSAFAARELYAANYNAVLTVDFIPELDEHGLKLFVEGMQRSNPKKRLHSTPSFDIPKSLWTFLLVEVYGSKLPCWAQLGDATRSKLMHALKQCKLPISGKGQFKEEFVTAGGVELKEIDFRTMESKLVRGLFFAGELIDVDGVTGGFNFQNAWTTGWIAGNSV